MGYDLNITRRQYWADSDEEDEEDEEKAIMENEFKQLVADDPQLEFRDDWFSTLKDGIRRYMAFLVGNIEVAELYIHADKKGMVPDDWNWLNWNDGNLNSKYPSSNMIRKMIEVANRLNAYVQGDDGEIYFINGDGELDSYEPDYPDDAE